MNPENLLRAADYSDTLFRQGMTSAMPKANRKTSSCFRLIAAAHAAAMRRRETPRAGSAAEAAPWRTRKTNF
jgi:hypothetical protein